MLARLRLRDLSDRQKRLLREGESGEVAAEIVAEELSLSARHRPDRADWFDVLDEENGTKAEVKSTWTEIGEEYPAGGCFRLWRAQLRSLLASDGQATAWVVFVLFDEDSGEVLVRRARPSTVWSWIVDDRGGWNRSGHAEWGKQHKLPYSKVFDDA